jgi:hypothetical protein
MNSGLDLPTSLLKLPLLAQTFGYPKVLAGSNFGHYKILIIYSWCRNRDLARILKFDIVGFLPDWR